MILEYDEFCMFLLNIEVFNIMTPDFPYTSENDWQQKLPDNREYIKIQEWLLKQRNI
jgi:hypothetical protein